MAMHESASRELVLSNRGGFQSSRPARDPRLGLRSQRRELVFALLIIAGVILILISLALSLRNPPAGSDAAHSSVDPTALGWDRA
jgi:hypothetical protein